MKKILVTGAGGFIGSHLTERLVKLGYRVRAFIKYNSRNNWGWLEESQYKNEIEVVTGDIRDYDSVYSAMRDCNTVFHLAALIGIPYSYVSPLAYIKTNIEGTYNVLQSAKELELENILITSTSETYGTSQYVPIDEKHPLVGQSPYAATKTAADQLAISFYLSFNLPVKIIRPFNTFGPRQSARAVIPTIIIQALTRDKIKIGSLTPIRDLTYVKDTVDGFIKIAESEKTIGEVVNIGTGCGVSIKELANLVIKIIGTDIKIVRDVKRVRPQKSEVMRLICDNKKAKRLVRWKPKYSLEEGLKEMVDWIQGNLTQYKSEFYNM